EARPPAVEPPVRKSQPARAASVPQPNGLDDALATPLSSLVELPSRMVTFAEREGLVTLGDLARRQPEELLAQRNLGRKSIQDARRIIEERTGCTWEELASRTAPTGVASTNAVAGAAVMPSGPRTWDELRLTLDDAQKGVLLRDLDLPARLRAYTEREG